MTYKLWYGFRNNFPKKFRYVFGEKIEILLLEILELFCVARYLKKQEKMSYLQKAGMKLDVLKFFLQIAWEIKGLDNKKYAVLSQHLNEVGKMLGGWIKRTSKENSALGGE